jgi:hypothetical protein
LGITFIKPIHFQTIIFYMMLYCKMSRTKAPEEEGRKGKELEE